LTSELWKSLNDKAGNPCRFRRLFEELPMESLAHLVTESLVRHGFEPTFDHRRLQWSKWFSCQDRFSLVTAPGKPGLFALGEEVAGLTESPNLSPDRSEGFPGSGRRMLALFQISEADDLGMALGRLFLAPGTQRDRFASGRCFARYVVIEDATQRQSALSALQRWMNSSAEAISTIPQTVETLLATSPAGCSEPRNNKIQLGSQAAERSPATFISGSVSSSESGSGAGSASGSVSGYGFSHTINVALPGSALAAASAQSAQAPESSNKQAQIGPPAPIPSGF
jgi:hypothetical protein